MAEQPKGHPRFTTSPVAKTGGPLSFRFYLICLACICVFLVLRVKYADFPWAVRIAPIQMIAGLLIAIGLEVRSLWKK